MIISCDLDDTLMLNQELYNDAKQQLASLLQDYCNASTDEIINRLDEIDYQKYSDVGVTKTRFAESCKELAEECGANETVASEAYEIGMSVFKTTAEYREIGLFEGADELISTINQIADTSVLLTAGIEEVQLKKIEATNLQERFDRVVITSDKSDDLQELKTEDDNVLHIGNSMNSDIEPAVEAGCDSILVNTNDWNRAISDMNLQTICQVDSLDECVTILNQNYR